MVPVLAHNQVDAGSSPAAATCCLDLIGFDRWLLPVAGGLFLFRLENVFLAVLRRFSFSVV